MAKSRSGPTGTGFCTPKQRIEESHALTLLLHEPHAHVARDARFRDGEHALSTIVPGLFHLALHLLQPLDTLLSGGVRREEARQRIAAQRRHDEERVDRLRLAEVLLRDTPALASRR